MDKKRVREKRRETFIKKEGEVKKNMMEIEKRMMEKKEKL